MQKLPNGNRVVFVHARDPKNPRVGICHALEVNEDNNVLALGIAQCSPKDNYSRKIGRTISVGRLVSAERRIPVPAIPLKESIATCSKAANEIFEQRHVADATMDSLYLVAKHIHEDPSAATRYVITYTPEEGTP